MYPSVVKMTVQLEIIVVMLITVVNVGAEIILRVVVSVIIIEMAENITKTNTQSNTVHILEVIALT